MYRPSERHDPENGISIGWNKRLSETETTPGKESLLALFLPLPDPSPRIVHGLLYSFLPELSLKPIQFSLSRFIEVLNF